MKPRLLKMAGLAVLIGPAVAYGQWVEVGDAGDILTGVQDTVGVGPLTTITGATGVGGDLVDAYCISITNPSSFYATTAFGIDPQAAATWDTRLFLFDANGNALLGNDDTLTPSVLQSAVSDPSTFPLLTGGLVNATAAGIALVPGDYILVVSGFSTDPLDAASFPLVDIGLINFTDLHGPNPAAGALASWAPPGATGDYTIALNGADFCTAPGTALSLVPDATCYGDGDQVLVSVNMTDATDVIAGGDFFLAYDTTALTFVSADPGDPPFTVELGEFVDPVAGTIDYGVGIPLPPMGTMDDTTMARITFTADGTLNPCTVMNAVTFRPRTPPEPPTRLVTMLGQEVLPFLNDLDPITIDGTPPDIVCPPPVDVECDQFLFSSKMHFPQWPNEVGWDVDATLDGAFFRVLADDWLCTETGEVLDIHFWGSWRGDVIGQVQAFGFRIHENIPIGPNGYSIPGPFLWSFATDVFDIVPVDPPALQGWFDPFTGDFLPGDHMSYFRYDVDLTQPPAPAPFFQQQGEIYWLSIVAQVADPIGTRWGWKTAIKNFEDDAVWADNPGWPGDPLPEEWQELIDPITFESLDMAFVITDGPPPDLGEPDVDDNCDLNPTVTFVDDTSGIGPGGTGTVIRTWTATDFCGNSASCDQLINLVDTTPPIILGCPADITVTPEAGECTAIVTWDEPRAYDNCCCIQSFLPDRMSGSVFPPGPTLVTYTAIDCNGNMSTCSFTVTVDPFNELVVDIDFDGAGFSSPITRCITFELRGVTPTPDAVVSADIVFTGGSVIDALVLVPCGTYDCLLVRDELHTLRRQATDFADTGATFEATLLNANTQGLLSGNVNDDLFIDILDFGTFVALYDDDNSGGPVSTPCGTPPFDADLNGDGDTDTLDFDFIRANYLNRSESCGPVDGADPLGAFTAGPVTRISVGQLVRRGLGDLVVADLNKDGWLDRHDVVAFMNGARP